MRKWEKLIRECKMGVAARGDTEWIFGPPLTPELIQTAEEKIGMPFPDDLREMYLEFDSLRLEHSEFYSFDVFMSLADAVVVNTEHLRDHDCYMSMNGLLFFGSHGNGDHLAYGRTLGGEYRHGIYYWSHDDDTRLHVADHLEELIRTWNDSP